jgi:hypothetical protein
MGEAAEGEKYVQDLCTFCTSVPQNYLKMEISEGFDM